MGRATEFIAYLNKDYLNVEDYTHQFNRIDITDPTIKKARRDYRAELRQQEKEAEESRDKQKNPKIMPGNWIWEFEFYYICPT